jgi:hypothetical protein
MQVASSTDVNVYPRTFSADPLTSPYLLHDPPLALFSAAYGATLSVTGGADAPRMIVTVPGSITGPEQEFVFGVRRQ